MAEPLPLCAAVARWAERALGVRCAVSLGLPRRVAGGERIPAGGVWLQFDHGLQPERAVHLWLGASLALPLVDRTLGGEALPTPDAHPAGNLVDAERGVLAYAAARACAEVAPGWRVAAVGERPDGLSEDTLQLAAHLRLGSAEGFGQVFLGGPEGPGWLPETDAVWILAAESGDLDGLGPGDVVLLDAPFTGGWLRVPGLVGSLPLHREGERVRSHRGPEPPPDAILLEVEAGAVAWAQVADLAGESCQPLALRPQGSRGRLRRPDAPPLEGELVRLRGCLGLRVVADDAGA